MEMLNDLFVNLCILGMFLFIFNLITRNRKGFISASANTHRKIQFGISMGILGVVLMQYTIHIDTMKVDLRLFPVIVAAIYGGRLPPILAATVIAAGRIGFFGVNKASIFAAVLIVIVGFLCGALSQLRLTHRKKWLMMTVSKLFLSSVVFYLLIDDWKMLTKIYTAYGAISLVGAITICFILEHMRETKEVTQLTEVNAAQDFLTGLNNVRKFDELLKKSFDKAEHHQENVSLILLDIDHFKQVNDMFGHLTGDEVLKHLGVIIRTACRSIDIVSRNGGEEFSIILPACSTEQALEIAERIRSKVERHEFNLSNGTRINITVSLGISTYGETTFQHKQLFKQADDCLYAAKRAGRNKVVRADLDGSILSHLHLP